MRYYPPPPPPTVWDTSSSQIPHQHFVRLSLSLPDNLPEPIYTPVTGSDVSINFILKIFPKVHADVEECLENFNWITTCLACDLTRQHSVNKNLASFLYLFAFFIQTHWQPWVWTVRPQICWVTPTNQTLPINFNKCFIAVLESGFDCFMLHNQLNYPYILIGLLLQEQT